MLIALLTDFGEADYFVASMKGVILSINPRATIVDITHEIPPQDVWKGAFVLKQAYKWFPDGAIFVGVVDPGVGTGRKAIILKTRRYYFVGPDNGLLSLAAEEDGVEEAYEITASLPRVSTTFHGRDVFAPVAAYLSLGIPPRVLGVPIEDFAKFKIPEPELKDGVLIGEIIYIDRFGNIFTSIRDQIFKLFEYNNELCLEYRGRVLRVRFVPSYGYVARGEYALVINSEGYVELSLNGGSAADELGAKLRDVVKLGRCGQFA